MIDSVTQFSKLLVSVQIAEENKMCHGMPGMAVKTPSGNFTPHHEQPQQQQSEEPSPLEIDGKWTPRMLAVLSGKPQDLMTVHPDSQLNRITQVSSCQQPLSVLAPVRQFSLKSRTK